MTTILKLLATTAILLSIGASVGWIDLDASTAAGTECQKSTKLDWGNAKVICPNNLGCPVQSGPCKVVVFFDGEYEWRYCKCENGQSEDPRSFDACFIVAQFKPTGELLDRVCNHPKCGPGGPSCSQYEIPGEPGVFKCHCQ